ncbi:hypothetical protein BG015_003440, partial [Linnemannia schmuckeri]
MTTILDLPEEIQLNIGEHLPFKSIYSCIRVCRSFYSFFIPRLWSDLNISHCHGGNIPATFLRANAHHVKNITYTAALTEEYYGTTVFPRLHTLRMTNIYTDRGEPTYLQVTPLQKIAFARLHPTIRKLVYDHEDTLPKEFWEIVGAEWTQLETLEFEGVVEADARDTFWRVCGQVQNLQLEDVIIPESVLVPPTLFFRRLQNLSIELNDSLRRTKPRQIWPLRLLDQVKTAEGLRRLKWDIVDNPFPVQMVQDILAKGFWPALCELSLGESSCSLCPDEGLAEFLRTLAPQRLKSFEQHCGEIGPLTYKSLQEKHFGHLQNLMIGTCSGVTSAMVQEVMMECAHLVHFFAPFVFLRDIVKAPKPWSCLKLERLSVCIVKQESDEPEWNGRVMKQISLLRRLQILNVDWVAAFLLIDDEPLSTILQNSGTLDLRLLTTSQSSSADTCSSNDDEPGGGSSDLSCWSSLVQLKEFLFDGDHQTLGMEEALWMMEHWRDMWCIEGKFKGLEGDDVDILHKMFKEK